MSALRNATALVGAIFVLQGAAGRATSVPAPTSFRVSINVDAGQSLGPLRPVWRFFGADEPNYAYMKDGEKLIGELGALKPGEVYFRTHNLLTTGDGTPALKWGSTNAYTEDAERAGRSTTGRSSIASSTPISKRGVRPYVADRLHAEGAVDQARAVSAPRGRRAAKYDEIYTGWAYPPKDYGKWGELVYQWAKHCVERYGRAKSSSGTGRSGTSRTSATGAARRRSSTSSTTTRSTPCAARCRRRASAGPDVAGSGGAFTARLPRALSARHELRDRRTGHAARLRLLSRQGRAERSSTATCGWGSPSSSATIDHGFALDRVVSPS